MQNRLTIYLILSVLLLILITIVSIYIGVYDFEQHSRFEIIKSIFSQDTSVSQNDRYIILDLRLPRIVMAILIGSALAVSGTCLQGMFKNPLATPDLIGITSGASLFAAIAIVLNHKIRPYTPELFHYSLLSISAFIGAFITMSLIYRISTSKRKTNVIIMLLSGVAVTALARAFTGFMTYLSTDEELRNLTFWDLGSLGGANWTKNSILVFVIIVSYPFLILKGKALNAMMLGEKDAAHLGIQIETIKKRIVILTALLVGTAVAFSGTIGFIGLIVPYILRLLFKSNYHIILPLSAVFGSILLLCADTISRTLLAPSEIPIGILTAFMGAPIFIVILLHYKKAI